MPYLEGRSHLKRESREPGKGYTTPVCQLGGDSFPHSRKALRLQFLDSRYGIPNSVAALLAPLVWKERS